MYLIPHCRNAHHLIIFLFRQNTQYLRLVKCRNKWIWSNWTWFLHVCSIILALDADTKLLNAEIMTDELAEFFFSVKFNEYYSTPRVFQNSLLVHLDSVHCPLVNVGFLFYHTSWHTKTLNVLYCHFTTINLITDHSMEHNCFGCL